MKKVLLLMAMPLWPAINLWDVTKGYRFINKTDEYMTISWHSGGNDTLTARQNMFKLAPLKEQIVKTVGDDCIDMVSIEAATTGKVASLNSVCLPDITIFYEGNVPHQRLVMHNEG